MQPKTTQKPLPPRLTQRRHRDLWTTFASAVLAGDPNGDTTLAADTADDMVRQYYKRFPDEDPVPNDE